MYDRNGAPMYIGDIRIISAREMLTGAVAMAVLASISWMFIRRRKNRKH